MLSQSAIQAIQARRVSRRRASHSRIIASIIVTTLATPKIATNKRCPAPPPDHNQAQPARRARPAPARVGPSTGYFSFRTYFGGAPTRRSPQRRAGTCHNALSGRVMAITPTPHLSHGSVNLRNRSVLSVFALHVVTVG